MIWFDLALFVYFRLQTKYTNFDFKFLKLSGKNINFRRIMLLLELAIP